MLLGLTLVKFKASRCKSENAAARHEKFERSVQVEADVMKCLIKVERPQGESRSLGEKNNRIVPLSKLLQTDGLLQSLTLRLASSFLSSDMRLERRKCLRDHFSFTNLSIRRR